MTSSDFNILKSYNKTTDGGTLTCGDLQPSSSKHRNFSTKRASRTDRRDGCFSKGRKNPATTAEDLNLDPDSIAFVAYSELQKKYNRLKRHYRKERKFYKGNKISLSK